MTKKNIKKKQNASEKRNVTKSVESEVKWYKDAGNLIALLALIVSVISFGYSYEIDRRTTDTIATERIQKVNVASKTNRVLSIGSVSYDVTVSNGSDLIIYDVTLIAPEIILGTVDGKISVDSEGKLNRIPLGDLSVEKEITKTITMENTPNAQIGEFSLEFKDAEGNWWLKESGKPAQRIK